MNWDRSQTIALAKVHCTHCHGYGMRPGRNDREVPCNCVFRAIFRACYARFKQLATQEKHLSRVSLEFGRGKESRLTYGRKCEEYLADFCLVSRKALGPLEYDLFRYHFLLGADWKLCCWRLKMSRGDFFHMVYNVENKLGRVFRELEPYGLYPLDEYFNGTIRKDRTERCPATEVVPIRPVHMALRPPLQMTA